MINTISRIWPRIGALLIDSVVLLFIGQIIGIFASNYLSKLDFQGLLIGLGISVFYFTVAYSGITNGQTIGKRLVKIKVVDRQNEYLNVFRSFLRASIFCIPVFLVNYPFSFLPEDSVITQVKTILLISLLIGIVLFPLINKATIQSIHDLFVASFVVKTDGQLTRIERVKTSSYIIYFGVILSLLIISFFALPHRNLNTDPNIANLSSIHKQLEKLPHVIKCSIYKKTTTIYSGNKTTVNYVEVNLKIKFKPAKQNRKKAEQLIDSTAKVILQFYDSVPKLDFIYIGLSYGFTIGIARRNYAYFSIKSPFEWQYPDSSLTVIDRLPAMNSGTHEDDVEPEGEKRVLTTTHKNGRLASQAIYIDNKLEGMYESWYPDGQYETTIEYKNGMRNGITTNYYPNGQKSSEILYRNNSYVQYLNKWDESGNVIIEEDE
jgi:uncharacterized RDD family membrane protein YckC